ncbi:hypothetical protein C8T65DRAFT_740867 [Cerioporus squamosus]|nr:hypothetical protein C8T65DRAFT_740867 [Cerioporus squamosus]
MFPQELYEEEVFAYDEELGEPLYMLRFKKPPSASDWTRFNLYAYRVQELGYFRNEFADVTEEVHHDNPTRRRDTTAILPKLLKVRVNYYDTHWADLLPFLLVGSKVTCLSIGAKVRDAQAPPVSPSLIVALPDICPTLTQLEMFSRQPGSVVEAAVQFSYLCPRLESFVLHNPIPCKAQLEVLIIEGPYGWRWSYAQEDYLCFVDLEPLLVFTRMRRFKLRAPFVIMEFANDAIKSIAGAWPVLYGLCIGGDGFLGRPSITWSGLAYLLWKCPELEALDFAFISKSPKQSLVHASASERRIWLQLAAPNACEWNE